MATKTKTVSANVIHKRSVGGQTKAKSQLLPDQLHQHLHHHLNAAHEVAHKAIHHGNRLFAMMAEASGIPHGYSSTVSWFAERLVLASLCLMALSFSAGAIFVLKWSEPIGGSQFYGTVSTKARLAQEGVQIYSQKIVDVASPIFGALVKDSRDSDEEITKDKLAERKAKLKAYLISKNSPFADDEATINAFAQSKNMKLMVAISFVESTLGKHCYFYNCSGIGGTPPNLRKYNSYAEWIADFDDLLERRYKDLPPEKFIGIYVQPGSPNWIYGVKQVIREFDEQQIEG